MRAEEALQFRVKFLLNPSLRTDVGAQQKVYELIRFFGRKKLRSELEDIHDKIFSDPGAIQLRREMDKLFSK